MSSSFDRLGDSLGSCRQPRGLRRQAARARRRDHVRRERQRQLDVQQLEQRLALAITVGQNLDAAVPYALISSDAGDNMYLSNLGNNTYAVADNSQFLDSGTFERYDLLEMQKVKEIRVTDAIFHDTTAPGQSAIQLAQASVQEFGLKHGGLFFSNYDGSTLFPLTGTLVDGSSRWTFTTDAGGALTFTGPASGRPVSGQVDPGFSGYSFDRGYGWGRPGKITINWGDGNTPDNSYIENLSYYANYPSYSGSRNSFSSVIGPTWFSFTDAATKYYPGVPTSRATDANLFSLDPNVVGGSVGVKTTVIAGVLQNTPGVLHIDNYGDVYFKAVSAEEGPAVQMALSLTKDGPYTVTATTGGLGGGLTSTSTSASTYPRTWVVVPSSDSRSGVAIGVNVTLNTTTGKLNVVTRWFNDTRTSADFADAELAAAQGSLYRFGDLVNPGHISIDINYRTYAAAKDLAGNEVPSSFTVYDGHDINQRLTVDLLGALSKVNIDSPVVASNRIELRAGAIRIDAPLQAVVDPKDPALDTKSPAASSLQVTTGKVIIGGSLHSAATARYVNINAAVSAETSYEITIAGSATANRSTGTEANGDAVGYLFVSPTGSLAGSLTTPQTKSTGLAIIDARSADIYIEGLVNAAKQTFLLRSDNADQNRHYLTTVGKYTGYQVGKVMGGTAVVLLGNDTDGVDAQNPSYITLATDLDVLRVRAAHLNANGPQAPLKYEMKISEATDIVIDSIAASSLPISLEAQGAMTFNASLETYSDLSIAVSKAFTVSAPLSSTNGTVTVTAGTDLTVANSVKSGSVNSLGAVAPGSIVLRAGKAYTDDPAKVQNGGLLKIASLVEATGGTVDVIAKGSALKASVGSPTLKQGAIVGSSRIRADRLVIDADASVNIGTDVRIITGTAGTGMTIDQTQDLNAYPTLFNKTPWNAELTLDNLSTTAGNLSVKAASNITLRTVSAGGSAVGDGDLLIWSSGVYERDPANPTKTILKNGTNITLDEGGVLALGDKVSLTADTGEILGTTVPVASWLDWTATALPDATGLYENIQRLSAYLKSGSTRADLQVEAPASISLEQLKTDNGNVSVTAAGAIRSATVSAGSGSSALKSNITLTTTTAGGVAFNSLRTDGNVEINSAAGVTTVGAGPHIAGVSTASAASAVIRAQGAVGSTLQRVRANAASVEVRSNSVSEPDVVYITLLGLSTALSVDAIKTIDVNTSGLTNDVILGPVTLGALGTLAVQATRNLSITSSIGSADSGTRPKLVSLTATTGGLSWGSGAAVTADAVALSAFKDLGTSNYEDVFPNVDKFSLARTGQGNIRAEFNRIGVVTLDGVTTAGGSVTISNQAAGTQEGSLYVTSKGITAGNGGSITLVAGDRLESGPASLTSRGVLTAATGRVALTAGNLIDVKTAAALLWANSTQSGSTIAIATTGDATIAASRDGLAVVPGSPVGIQAGPDGAADGLVSLSVNGKLMTESKSLISAASASITARTGIQANVNLTGPLSANTSSGNVAVQSTRGLVVGAAGIRAAGGDVSISAGTSLIPVDGNVIGMEAGTSAVILGRTVSLTGISDGGIDVKTSATTINATTKNGSIVIRETDSVAIGDKGISAGLNPDTGKFGDVALTVNGALSTLSVAGQAPARVKGETVTINVASGAAISTAATTLAVTSKRGNVVVDELDDVTIDATSIMGGSYTLSAKLGDITVNSLKLAGSGGAVSLTAKPITVAGGLRGTGKIMLATGGVDDITGRDITPIDAAGNAVNLVGGRLQQTQADKVAIRSQSLSLLAGATGTAVDLVVQADAIAARATNGDINLIHVGSGSAPLVLGASLAGQPAVIRADNGNVTVRSTTSNIVVAASPVALTTTPGTNGTVKIVAGSETTSDDKTVTFIVSNALSEGAGSLREALTLANANAEPDQGVAFASDLTATISLTKALDPILKKITLDGGRRFVRASNQFSTGAATQVAIDGSSLSRLTEKNGIEFQGVGASGSVLKGLAIQGFSGAGVKLTNVSNVTVRDNTLGFLRASGAVSGNKYGVLVTSGLGGTSSGNVVTGNVIGSNGMAGIRVENAGTTGTVITKNLVGTTATRLDRGNVNYGVWVDSAGAGTVVGDARSATTLANGNLFMFNGTKAANQTATGAAALLVNETNGVVVRGNEFSSNDGTAIHIKGSTTAFVGSNTITRNGDDGIFLDNSSNATVDDNSVGTDRFRTLGLGNNRHGIAASAGGTHTVSSNVVMNSGSAVGSLPANGAARGISFVSSGSGTINGNTVLLNTTGLVLEGSDARQTTVRGNTISNSKANGVEIRGTTAALVGAAAAAGVATDGNKIQLNGGAGVSVADPTAKATIVGNSIAGNVGGGIVRTVAEVSKPTPTITSARLASGKLTLAVNPLTALANTTVWIDVYQAEANGQGTRWLGRQQVAIGPTGAVPSVPPFSVTGVATGNFVIATITNSAGHTSAFSDRRLVTA